MYYFIQHKIRHKYKKSEHEAHTDILNKYNALSDTLT
jgi:hypothetical protein